MSDTPEKSAPKPAPAAAKPPVKAPKKIDKNIRPRYLRFPVSYRIEHWIFMASFTTLAITGLSQKYESAPLARDIIRIFNGIDTIRLIHHYAATLMMVMVVYHLGVIGYRLYVRHTRPSMLPSLMDVRMAIRSLAFNLGLSKTRPQQGRYTFEEKVEYWAVVWGTVVMAITGFMMLNPIATTRFLPGEFIPAAKAAHGGEALLAVLAIIIWHLYHVLVRQLNKSMFNGYLSEEEMLDEHPLELADIKAGIATRPVDEKAAARRARIFFPSYGVVAAGLLVGIYFFVSFEKTAITTIPPAENVNIFAPLTPTPLPTALPTRTPAPLAGSSWEMGIGSLLQQKCTGCHNPSARISGLDLTTYQGALTGGNSGPAVVPGDPDHSQIVIQQSTGDHPSQLTGDELTLIRNWIAAGAPEK
jgi:formate dehydrogenase gamma subunit